MLNAMTEPQARPVPVENEILAGDSKSLRRLQISLYSQAAEEVTGDFFDFFRVSQSQSVLVMGDIAGKGALAAALAAEVQAVLRAYCSSGDPAADQAAPPSLCPTQVVSYLNRYLYSTTAPELFATLFLGIFDCMKNQLVFTNAAHVPPVLIRGGDVVRLETTGTLVGAFGHPIFTLANIKLRTGDLLVGFTDGVIEAETRNGEQFGEQRLVELLARKADQPAEEIIHTIMKSLVDWVSRPSLHDDAMIFIARPVDHPPLTEGSKGSASIAWRDARD